VSILVRFWGTRGSIPTPGSKTRRYGGNTSCVAIDVDGGLFILDAGTGLRELGDELLSRGSEPIEAHLLFSHTHWDHIQGFPFFRPAYQPTTRLHVYEIARDDERFTRLLLGQMRSEYFPVSFSDLGGHIVPEYFSNGRSKINGVTLHCLEQTHPGRSFAYRVEVQGKHVVYATDTELDLLLENADACSRDREICRIVPRRITDFVRDADLLIADAQYTDEEYRQKVGWGHSCISTVVDMAAAAQVKRLALFHHDPSHSDDRIDNIVDAARRRALVRGSKLDVFAAREGLTLKVG
jgi:phosphoribosyl 1,2-cyclic phosphodiesterase